MKMLIFVLNRVEKLEPALNKLEHAGLRGATVLSSRGMAMTLDKYTATVRFWVRCGP